MPEDSPPGIWIYLRGGHKFFVRGLTAAQVRGFLGEAEDQQVALCLLPGNVAVAPCAVVGLQDAS